MDDIEDQELQAALMMSLAESHQNASTQAPVQASDPSPASTSTPAAMPAPVFDFASLVASLASAAASLGVSTEYKMVRFVEVYGLTEVLCRFWWFGRT